MDTNKIELINQGSYGCIYHPGLTCKGKLGNSRFVTKIQKRRANSDKESHVGKTIKKIKHYQNFFAPVLYSCPVNLSVIDNKELKKCEFVAEKPNATYMSNRIKYIGSETLTDYLLRMFETNPKLFLHIFVDSYLHILTGLTLLNESKIVHMDLKDNNIVIDEKIGTPIVIDFGMSFYTTDVKKQLTLCGDKHRALEKCRGLTDVFFVYGSDYAPWCIEISMISYINEIKNIDVIVTQEQVDYVINDFLDTNPVFKYVTSEEYAAYGNAMRAYIKPMIGKPWKELIAKLIESIDTWDNYAIAAVMLQFASAMEISLIVNTLKEVILSMPDKRGTASETKIRITETVNKIANKRELLHKLHEKSKDKDFIQKLTTKNKNTKVALLKREENMNQKMFQV